MIIRKKYRLIKWSILSKAKSGGEMGIIDLDAQNICLLRKWLFKLLNEDDIWQRLIKRKYLGNKTLSQVSSQFFFGRGGLMEIKDFFLSKRKSKVQSGNQTRFWEDLWSGDKTLKEI